MIQIVLAVGIGKLKIGERQICQVFFHIEGGVSGVEGT